MMGWALLFLPLDEDPLVLPPELPDDVEVLLPYPARAISPQPPAEEELEPLLPPDPLRPEYSKDGPVLRLPPDPPEPPPEAPPPELPLPDPPPPTGGRPWRSRSDPPRGCRLLLSAGGAAPPRPDGAPGLAIACQVTEGGITGFGAAGGGLPGGT